MNQQTSNEDQPLNISSTPEKKNNTRRLIIDIVETLLLALVFYFAIDAVSARVRVKNVSMQPTLYEGEFLLVNRLAYKFSPPQTGDIVIFHAPTEPGEDFIKRIIGTPGDIVSVNEGKVFVNGIRLDEPYIADVPRYNGEWSVPDNQIFVLGDNRNQSSDSHVWGFVSMDVVVGKALLVYYPFNKIALLDHPDVVQASQPN